MAYDAALAAADDEADLDRPPPYWSDSRIATLKKLWLEGITCSIIATRLGNGATRCSVVCKAHRLGLPRRKETPPKGQPRPPPPKPRAPPRLKIVRPPSPPPRAVVPESAWLPLPGSTPKTLMHRTAEECAWPVGDGPQQLFCCLPSQPGGYCPEHAATAFLPTTSAASLVKLLRRYL